MTSTAWTFHNPTRASFGAGRRSELAGHIAGKRVLVVTSRRGRSRFQSDPLLCMDAADELTWIDGIMPNPALSDLEADIAQLSGRHVDVVVAFGGGSALDAGKALSVALGVGGGRKLADLIATPSLVSGLPAVPLIAMPTTSGTGAEVTPFATIWDMAAKKKLSLALPIAQPAVAIVDPELTYSLPEEETYATGLDALNQALESGWNRNASPVTLAMAGVAIRLAIPSLHRLAVDLGDIEARSDMAEASLIAGFCISQTRTAICHSLSYPITAHFEVPHGLACAFTMEAAAALCLEREEERFDQIAGAAGYHNSHGLLDGIADLVARLGVRQRVRKLIPDFEALMALRGEMFTPGRADNYVVPIDADTVSSILARAYGS